MDRSIPAAPRRAPRLTFMVAVAGSLLALMLALAAVAYAATINGTEGPDVLVGTANPDQIIGRGGNDEIRGLAQRDVLRGSLGNDTIYGGTGEDTLTGDKGDDLLIGGDDKESDEFYGGQGRDTCVLAARDHASHNVTGCEVITNRVP